MKVRISFFETGTGESSLIDAELAEVTIENIIVAIRNEEEAVVGEVTDYIDVKGFVVSTHNAKTYGFTLVVPAMHYFGDVIFSGVVYTEFT